MFLGLTVHAWITLAVLVTAVILTAKTKLPPDFTFIGAVAVLLVTHCIGEHEALAGFGSETVVVTGAQDIVIMGLLQSGALMWVVQKVLKRPKKLSRSILRLMFPVALLSSVMEDLTVTTAFVEIVKSWAKKIKMAPSKLLIPMAYAALMGGTLTIIGTPPNIIISSLYAERTGEHLNIFVITIPALFCMLMGIGCMMLLRNKLPDRKSPEHDFESTDDYTVELLVPTENPAVGMTVEEAGLTNVPGGRLIEIVRFDEEVISPVPADEFILGGDHLVYSGEVDEILELKRSKKLVNATHHVFSVKDVELNRKLRTATVKFNGRLVGVKIADTTFEEDNNVVLVAVSRSGERVHESPRDIVLMAGDTLLLECPPDSSEADAESLKKDLQFFDSYDTVTVGKKSVVSALIMLVMVALVATGAISLLEATLLAATATLILRCCSVEMARKSIEWELLLMIACSVVFGKAIEVNGITDVLARGMQFISGSNPYMMLLVLCTAVMIVTEFFSNAVTAAVFFPIVFESATSIGCDPLPFTLAAMIAVSSSYATPFSSPVNMVIFGAGGYHYSDYLKVGLPLKLVTLLSIMIIIPLMYSL